jgi:hypothetical protein
MKGRKDKVSDFRVPLSQEAKNVIEKGSLRSTSFRVTHVMNRG